MGELPRSQAAAMTANLLQSKHVMLSSVLARSNQQDYCCCLTGSMARGCSLGAMRWDIFLMITFQCRLLRYKLSRFSSSIGWQAFAFSARRCAVFALNCRPWLKSENASEARLDILALRRTEKPDS